MIPIGAFVGLSLPILWVSRRSLLHPTSHGFSRFFAFEAILGLFILNAPSWFDDPLGVRQVVSWLLMGVSVVFVVWGLSLLRRVGGSRPTAEVSPTFEWERTETLVTTGIYHYIRHPMYSSLLFLAWGACLKSVTIYTVLLCVAATVALAATARTEEAENLLRFGDEYRVYMKRTRRFVPFLL